MEESADPADLLKVAESLNNVAENQCVLEYLELDIANPNLGSYIKK